MHFDNAYILQEGAEVKDRNGNSILMSVNKLLDVEEHIWSPMYGLKGNIDATVQVCMRDDEGERTLAVPMELKTGKNSTNSSHRAQTALYTLLLSDRYGLYSFQRSDSVLFADCLRCRRGIRNPVLS